MLITMNHLQSLRAEISDSASLFQQMQQRDVETSKTFRTISDRRASRLEKHRLSNRHFYEAIQEPLSEWAREDYASFEPFYHHVLWVLMAASTRVRAFDIISWYGEIPRYAEDALNASMNHYHLDASLSADLRSAEISSGSWSVILHPEIEYAARHSNLVQKKRLTTYVAFGKGICEEDIGAFEKSPLLSGREFLLKVKANFEVRKVIFDKAALRRYPAAGTFPASIHPHILRWCDGALQELYARKKLFRAEEIDERNRILFTDILSDIEALQEETLLPLRA